MPRARKPPAVVSAIRSAIARAAWGKLSADERKARQQRVWAKRKAAQWLRLGKSSHKMLADDLPGSY